METHVSKKIKGVAFEKSRYLAKNRWSWWCKPRDNFHNFAFLCWGGGKMAAPSDSESDPMRSITPSSELEEYKRVFTTFSFIFYLPLPPAYLFPKFPEENDHWGLWCLGCPRRFLSRDWPFVWETTWTISTRSSSALFQLLKHPGGCLDFLVLLSSPQWKLNSVGYLQNLTLSS